MDRDLSRVHGEPFDLLVVGAGIYGATIAWEAAQRGFSVALIDRGDFGAGTSFNCHKTVHGGLRSVQQGNLKEMREFIRERRALSRIAPHLVHPLPFLVPTYRHPMRSRAALHAALTIHNLVSFDRNDIPDPSKHLPAGRVISRAECLDRYPGLDPAGVTGGALWYDCQMYNTDRLGLAFVQSAVGAGAAAANHVEATAFLTEGARVVGVKAHDRLDDQRLEIRASLVVNAAGPWATEVLQRLAAGRPTLAAAKLSKAMNVITRRVPASSALGGLARGRFLFMIPWRDYSLVGTSHEPFDGAADSLEVTTRDVEAFMADVAEAFPGAGLGVEDVRLVHRGLLPMVSSTGADVRLLKQSQIRDHRADGVSGLMSVVGVRYTTARHTAERAVDRASQILDRGTTASRSAVTPLPGGDIEHFDRFFERSTSPEDGTLSRAALERIVRSYGTAYGTILEAIVVDAEEGQPLGPDCGVTRAEVRHAVRHEMARTLADAVLRRTEAGSAGHPGPEALTSAARVVGDELGWSPDHRRDEIAAVERFYRVPG